MLEPLGVDDFQALAPLPRPALPEACAGGKRMTPLATRSPSCGSPTSRRAETAASCTAPPSPPPHSRRRPGKSNWPPLRSAPSSRAGNGKVQTAGGRGFTVCIDECVACGHGGAASSIPPAVAACDPREPLPEVPSPVPPSRARLPGAPTRGDPASAPTSDLHEQGPLGRTPRPSGSVPLSLLPRGRGKEPLWPPQSS